MKSMIGDDDDDDDDEDDDDDDDPTQAGPKIRFTILPSFTFERACVCVCV
uniref:Uncharacterized protein n=1 Tax=Rhizophora mucronata TaxID=61149 RepID=A0A2P2KXU1_RHIMU